MTTNEIVTALRCISSPGGKEQHCERCPFYAKEHLSAEVAEKVGTDEWPSCDCDTVGFAAADLIENQQREIEALRQANTALQERRKWIPVTERLPEKGAKVLLYAPKVEDCRQSGIFVGELTKVNASDGRFNFWNVPTHGSDWTLWGWSYFEKPNVTHWMPLPEAPEVE